MYLPFGDSVQAMYEDMRSIMPLHKLAVMVDKKQSFALPHVIRLARLMTDHSVTESAQITICTHSR